MTKEEFLKSLTELLNDYEEACAIGKDYAVMVGCHITIIDSTKPDGHLYAKDYWEYNGEKMVESSPIVYKE